MSAPAKALVKAHKSRLTRTIRDQVDRALVDLLGLFRDVLVSQFDAPVTLVNQEMHPQIAQLAASSTAADTGRRLDAIAHARAQLRADVTPLVSLESLMVELKDPWIRAASA